MEPKVPNARPTASRGKQDHAVDRRRMLQRRKFMLAPENTDAFGQPPPWRLNAAMPDGPDLHVTPPFRNSARAADLLS